MIPALAHIEPEKREGGRRQICETGSVAYSLTVKEERSHVSPKAAYVI